MTLVALLICVFICAVGVLTVASPSRHLRLIRLVSTRRGFSVAGGIRVLLGVGLLIAAPTSRAPGLIQILGIIIIFVAVIMVLFGPEPWQPYLDWWSARRPGVMRGWGVLAVAVAVALAYALVPG